MNKRFLLLGAIALLLVGCNPPKEQTVQEVGELTEVEEVEIAEDAGLNLEKTEYEGTYTGKVGGREVSIAFMEDYEYEMTDNKKESSGRYERLEDGTRIELFPEEGVTRIKFLALSDKDNWIVLNNKGEYPDKDEFLVKSN